MIELVLALIMLFGTGRIHSQVIRRPPPGECPAVSRTAQQPQVPGCQPPDRRTAR